MGFIYYTLMGIGLYLAADWIVDRMEVSRGERLKYRSLVFFAVIMVLAFLSFNFVNYLMLTAE